MKDERNHPVPLSLCQGQGLGSCGYSNFFGSPKFWDLELLYNLIIPKRYNAVLG